ncbi:MAG: DUF2148 domain-containing protein [Rikenellaceae bacterium]
MVLNQRNCAQQDIINVAHRMMTAARTAPKGKGIDVIDIVLIEGDDLKLLSNKMEELSEVFGLKFFLRDAGNILDSQAVVVIGTSQQAMGLNCGYCGYSTCAGRHEGVPCAINSVDVGIAIGSACSIAADMRVDNRVMFSAGIAAQHLGWLADGVSQSIAIALSASSKSPFFDRKPKE